MVYGDGRKVAVCEMVAGLGHRMEGRRMGGPLVEITPREQVILTRIRAFPKLFSVLAPQLTSRRAKLLALKIRAAQLKKERNPQ